jgi:ribonucleoside-diphosphate reductase alpha chain
MIDLSIFPLDMIEAEVKKTRKLGLGVVGLATMFYEIGIPYDSDKAIDLTRKIIKFIQEESVKQSEELAKTRGTFPDYKGSKLEEPGLKVRNATMSSVAPTGTLV